MALIKNIGDEAAVVRRGWVAHVTFLPESLPGITQSVLRQEPLGPSPVG